MSGFEIKVVKGKMYRVTYVGYKKYELIIDDKNELIMDDKKQFFTSYRVIENQFEPIGESVNKLPSGFYSPSFDSYNNKTYLNKKDVVMPTLYELPNEVQKMIMDDIRRFWSSEDLYRKFGSVYKRSILLYSQPGNGKTSLINMLCNILLNEYDGIVITIDNGSELIAYKKIMEKIRSIEPNRKVIALIEDFEQMATSETYMPVLLQLLDGAGQFDGVVTFATTNHPEKIEKNFISRPSRFNIVIEYKKPNAEIRKAYIEKKLSGGGIDINNEKVKADIARYVKKSEGYTFDYVKELVQAIYVDGRAEVEVFDSLNKMIKKDGKVKVSESEPRSIGFGNVVSITEDELVQAESGC